MKSDFSSADDKAAPSFEEEVDVHAGMDFLCIHYSLGV